MSSHHHFLSFMEKDSWVIKIERIEKLCEQILKVRGTRRVDKVVERKELLHSLIPDMDVWYADRCNVAIDFRKKVSDLRITVAEQASEIEILKAEHASEIEILKAEHASEIGILEANLKDAVCGYKAYQALLRKELPPMEEPDFSFLDSLDDLTISQEEEVAGTKQ